MNGDLFVLLTICIPTLNRAERVCSLVQYLGNYIKNNWVDKVDIIVSDNCSSDATQALLDIPSKALGVKVIRREAFIETAEQHVAKLIYECEADFIWVLGDDDIPNLASLDILIQYLEQDAADIYVFNHREILQNGSLLTESMLQMNAPFVDLSGRNLPMAVGFISTFSMFSNVVFRRLNVSIDVGNELIRLSPIYSHVAWHIISFNDKRARVVNFPLVNHRADFKNINTYFEKHHKTSGLSDFHIWTTGLLSLLRYLIEHNHVTAAELAKVYEHDFNGVRFRLVDRILNYLFLRLEAVARESRSRNTPSTNLISEIEMSLFFDTIISIDAGLQDQMFILKKMCDWCNAAQQQSKLKYKLLAREFRTLHNSQIGWQMYSSVSLGIVYGYSVLQTVVGFVAIQNKENYFHNNCEKVLGQIDPIEHQDKVLTSLYLIDLIEKIKHEVMSGEQVDRGELLFGNSARLLSAMTLYYALTPLRWMGESLISGRIAINTFFNRLFKFILRKVVN